MPRQVTKQREQEIIEMHKADLAPSEIAKELDISVPTVYSVLKRKGITPNKRKVAKNLTKRQQDKLRSMYYDQLLPLEDILPEFKMNHNDFYAFLRENEWKPRTKTQNYKAIRQLQMDTAIQYYIDGMKIVEIEAETGIYQSQLHKEVHRRKIPLRSEVIIQEQVARSKKRRR